MAVFGLKIESKECHERKIVCKIVPHDKLLPTCVELAHFFAPKSAHRKIMA